MIASLPMYDRAETAAANDRLWAALRAALGGGPTRLRRASDPWDDWQSPELILSQTCGLPYRSRLHGRVTLVASPVHRLPGCTDGYYNSVIVARRDDPRQTTSEFGGAPFAFNGRDSQSGWAALRAHLADLDVSLGTGLETGAHRRSAQAVADGRADLAALDPVSWLMMKEWDGFARDLRVIETTAPTPALPFITAPDRDGAAMFTALDKAIAALDRADRDRLRLFGVTRIPPKAYLEVALPD